LRYFYFEPDCSLRLNMLAFNFQVLFKKYEVEHTSCEKFGLFHKYKLTNMFRVYISSCGIHILFVLLTVRIVLFLEMTSIRIPIQQTKEIDVSRLA
jgi:preprotein translocase subunit SecY